jgi:hypothetical protein
VAGGVKMVENRRFEIPCVLTLSGLIHGFGV